MSSILIKGMKKPENCFHCPMGYRYGEVDDAKLMCTITVKVIPLGESLDIMKNCPLVEIPPHGRLIDASETAIKLSCRDLDITTIKNLHELLMEIPTVIEAEE